MSQFPLSADDLPLKVNELDQTWRYELEAATSKYFYEACDGVTQGLLLKCKWHMTTRADALTLVLSCTDISIHWRVINNVVAISSQLEKFASNAKIRICPPEGIPSEIRVNEISIPRDLL